jgi:hypothetical protein
MRQNDIILSGIPRSGTTLVCYLLNQLPNVVALAEPMDVSALWKLRDQNCIIAEVVSFFSMQRQSLLLGRKALSKAVEGRIRDNYFGNDMNESGLRGCLASQQTITIKKSLSDNFILVVKHPNAFTVLLESLIECFPCFAIIRNPLAALASWNTVNVPVSNGHAPVAESLDTELAARLAGQEDRYQRQISLLSWYYEKYSRNLPETHIIRYEDIVSSSGRCLEVISPGATELSQALESRNKNVLYDADLIHKLGTMLLNTKGSFWDFYRQEDIEQLMQNN